MKTTHIASRHTRPARTPAFRTPIARARLLLAAVLTLLAGPSAAQNVSVRDYSVPVSRADNLRIDALSFNYVTEGEEVRSETGNMGVVYKKFYESLPFAYSIDFIGSASYNRDSNGDRKGNFTTDLSTRVKKYLRSEGNFFFVEDTDLDFDKDFDRPSIDLTVGIGFGRFINATALRKAVRIEDFLLEEGIITERMPKETMIQLGHIIEKRQEYEDLYGDRYQNYWFEDMSNEITKADRVLGSIGAIGLFRMQEVLFRERIGERFYGWEATAGVKFEVLTSLESRDRRDPAMSIGLRYSRPISWSTQINTRLEVNSPFSGNKFGRVYNLTQSTDFTYEFTNKISLSIAHIVRADKPQRDTDTTLSTALSVAFNFFIENKINLTASEQINKIEDLPLRQGFNIGLSYRIF